MDKNIKEKLASIVKQLETLGSDIQSLKELATNEDSPLPLYPTKRVTFDAKDKFILGRYNTVHGLADNYKSKDVTFQQVLDNIASNYTALLANAEKYRNGYMALNEIDGETVKQNLEFLQQDDNLEV